MKLMWFHLMPYTELPANFCEANPSKADGGRPTREIPAYLPKIAAG